MHPRPPFDAGMAGQDYQDASLELQKKLNASHGMNQTRGSVGIIENVFSDMLNNNGRLSDLEERLASLICRISGDDPRRPTSQPDTDFPGELGNLKAAVAAQSEQISELSTMVKMLERL